MLERPMTGSPEAGSAEAVQKITCSFMECGMLMWYGQHARTVRALAWAPQVPVRLRPGAFLSQGKADGCSQ
jgi:hypothetical protein